MARAEVTGAKGSGGMLPCPQCDVNRDSLNDCAWDVHSTARNPSSIAATQERLRDPDLSTKQRSDLSMELGTLLCCCTTLRCQWMSSITKQRLVRCLVRHALAQAVPHHAYHMHW